MTPDQRLFLAGARLARAGTYWKDEVCRYLRVLRRAGFDATALENDDGSQVGPVKVGSVHRAKGLSAAKGLLSVVTNMPHEPEGDAHRVTDTAVRQLDSSKVEKASEPEPTTRLCPRS
ncbi:hypothetical protein ACIBEH_31030 [Nocardia salmonicida]|uniref:hypothetical protein n=1 Tax=Nocardia TaxID=1817 RepID=UPI00265A1D09|nr:hypothetical protein [Nocardia sp. PE-7]WKG11162.1 hypothetical protein QX204_06755 [Nocardia sp. PE-7]